jgi:hypothetical protein
MKYVKLSLLFPLLFLISTTVVGGTNDLSIDIEKKVIKQCINGPDSITQGQIATYTAAVNAQAYYWTVTSGLSIIGSNTGSSVQIQCNGNGGTISLTRFVGGNCYSCTKTITCTSTGGCNHSTPTLHMSATHTGLHLTFILNTTFSSDPYSSLTLTSNIPELQLPTNGIPAQVSFSPFLLFPLTATMTLVITYPDGCTDTIVIDVLFELFGNGINRNKLDNKKSNIRIYPNPTSNILNIENKKEIHINNFEIRKLVNGLLVKKLIVNSKRKNIKIDVNGLKEGIYTLILFDKNNNMISIERLLIDH